MRWHLVAPRTASSCYTTVGSRRLHQAVSHEACHLFEPKQDLPGALRQQQVLVAASAVGRPVEVHAYADRVVIRQDGPIVAEHPRSFGRADTLYNPWQGAAGDEARAA
jgi:hypothetical protein